MSNPLHPSSPVAGHHSSGAPSSWVTRWAHLIRPAGHVLDVACGSGRHVRWLGAQGLHITALDRDAAALQQVRETWPPNATGTLQTVAADIESGPWPLADHTFDALVVTHYLWRPLWPQLLQAVRPGGVFIYETFADGNATVGKPSRPDFLLANGELLRVFAHWRIVAYEDGFLPQPDRFVQRIVAVRPPLNDGATPARHPLAAPAGHDL